MCIIEGNRAGGWNTRPRTQAPVSYYHHFTYISIFLLYMTIPTCTTNILNVSQNNRFPHFLNYIFMLAIYFPKNKRLHIPIYLHLGTFLFIFFPFNSFPDNTIVSACYRYLTLISSISKFNCSIMLLSNVRHVIICKYSSLLFMNTHNNLLRETKYKSVHFYFLSSLISLSYREYPCIR